MKTQKLFDAADLEKKIDEFFDTFGNLKSEKLTRKKNKKLFKDMGDELKTRLGIRK